MFTSSQHLLDKYVQSINEEFQSKLQKIATRFSLDLEELKTCCETTSVVVSTTKSKSVSKKLEKVPATLEKVPVTLEKVPATLEKVPVTLEKTESENECKVCQHVMGGSSKNKGQKCGGKVGSESKSGLYCKTHLKNENSSSTVVEKEKKPKVEKEPVVAEKKKVKIDPNQPLINNNTDIKKLIEERTSNLSVKKNSFGNYEHSASRLVLHSATKEVYGKQNDDGTVSELTSADINLAKTVGFKNIKIPDNLTTTRTTTTINIMYDDGSDSSDSDIESSDSSDSDD